MRLADIIAGGVVGWVCKLRWLWTENPPAISLVVNQHSRAVRNGQSVSGFAGNG